MYLVNLEYHYSGVGVPVNHDLVNFQISKQKVNSS